MYNFVLLGARATGKTTYLASLYAEEPGISANDAQTVDYLKEEWISLVQGSVHPTPFSLHELRFLYRKQDTKIVFSIDDYDGYFAESLGHTARLDSLHDTHDTSESEYETLKRKIVTSDGLLFFFPYETEHHTEAEQNFRNEINTYIQLINEFYPHCTTLPIPVVLAVTKWDRSPYYQADDETEHAVAYLKSIEVFRQAKVKIENFFPNVHVVPMACFPPQADTADRAQDSTPRHACCPYNLTKPFDIFVTEIFRAIEEQIAVLQNDIPRLYTYLRQLDASLLMYHGATLGRLQEQIEADYVEKVTIQLAQARSPRARKRIISTHKALFETCHAAHLRDHLARLISTAKRRNVQDRLRRPMMVMMVCAVVVMMTYAFLWLEAEATAFTQVTTPSTERSPIEQLELTQAYLEHYSERPVLEMIFVLIRDLIGRRGQVEQIQRSLYTTLETSLFDQLTALQTTTAQQTSLTTEQRDTLTRLEQSALRFPQLSVSQQITSFIEALTQEQREAGEIEAFFIEIDVLLTNQTQDLPRLQNSLNRVIALSHRQDAVVTERMAQIVSLQRRLEQYLHTVEQTRLNQQRLQERTRAKAMLEAQISDRLALQSSLDLLEPFGTESEVVELRRRLAQRITEIIRDEHFDTLYQQLLNSRTMEEMRTNITQTWPDSGFTDMHRRRLQTLLDGKISSFEFRSIDALTNQVSSFQALDQLEETLQTLDGFLIDIPIIDYHYQGRSEAQQQRIDQAKQAVTRYRQALDQGVVIRHIVFTIDDQTNPLGLNCPIRGNSEGQIMITQTTFDQTTAVCEYRSDAQIMHWTAHLRLGLGEHTIELREIDSFLAGGDDILTTTITFQPEDLLRLINGGLVVRKLPGNYELGFLTQGQG